MGKNRREQVEQVFGPEALPLIQATELKHQRDLKALTQTSGLASSFLHPPPDS